MSVDKLRTEAKRWVRQGRDDLEAAICLCSAGKLAQAGFFAQQAAEKAIKGVLVARDQDPWGQSIAKLIAELPSDCRSNFEPLRDLALSLDKLYIPTRYPDAVPDLIPAEAFSRAEIDVAITGANELVTLAERSVG